MQNQEVAIRPATIEDLEFIVSLVPRLTEFGPPSWRDKLEMINADTRIITDKLKDQPEGTAIFVAFKGEIPLGFIHLQTGRDYYSNAAHGHISDLVVSLEGQGKGIGSLLMKKGEEWAKSKGFHWLTLSVFAQNANARAIYEKNGYGQDIMKYVKKL